MKKRRSNEERDSASLTIIMMTTDSILRCMSLYLDESIINREASFEPKGNRKYVPMVLRVRGITATHIDGTGTSHILSFYPRR